MNLRENPYMLIILSLTVIVFSVNFILAIKALIHDKEIGISKKKRRKKFLKNLFLALFDALDFRAYF